MQKQLNSLRLQLTDEISRHIQFDCTPELISVALKVGIKAARITELFLIHQTTALKKLI